MRIKSRWSKQGKTHTVEEIAGALAFIAWRIATNGILSMEHAEFDAETQEERLQIITEFLAFTLHMADRITIERFDKKERLIFMTELSLKSAKHMEDNKRDILGPGEYRQEFIDLLNIRLAEYSEYDYTEDDGPSFRMKRQFGSYVAKIFGEKDEKWVSTQIMDIEVREILVHLERATPNLFK